jgi:hypothetical protein
VKGPPATTLLLKNDGQEKKRVGRFACHKWRKCLFVAALGCTRTVYFNYLYNYKPFYLYGALRYEEVPVPATCLGMALNKRKLNFSNDTLDFDTCFK